MVTIRKNVIIMFFGLLISTTGFFDNLVYANKKTELKNSTVYTQKNKKDSSKKNQKQNEGYNCSICLDSTENQETKTLTCGHTFHSTCIEQWITKGSDTNCPLCRKPIEEISSALRNKRNEFQIQDLFGIQQTQLEEDRNFARQQQTRENRRQMIIEDEDDDEQLTMQSQNQHNHEQQQRERLRQNYLEIARTIERELENFVRNLPTNILTIESIKQTQLEQKWHRMLTSTSIQLANLQQQHEIENILQQVIQLQNAERFKQKQQRLLRARIFLEQMRYHIEEPGLRQTQWTRENMLNRIRDGLETTNEILNSVLVQENAEMRHQIIENFYRPWNFPENLTLVQNLTQDMQRRRQLQLQIRNLHTQAEQAMRAIEAIRIIEQKYPQKKHTQKTKKEKHQNLKNQSNNKNKKYSTQKKTIFSNILKKGTICCALTTALTYLLKSRIQIFPLKVCLLLTTPLAWYLTNKIT